ncbi:hypothetical protein ABBQ38_012620 [Trebouxia sp. C0009 RCD-2024]
MLLWIPARFGPCQTLLVVYKNAALPIWPSKLELAALHSLSQVIRQYNGNVPVHSASDLGRVDRYIHYHTSCSGHSCFVRESRGRQRSGLRCLRWSAPESVHVTTA